MTSAATQGARGDLRLKLIKAVGVWATTDRDPHAHFRAG
jgi:hypothetical protein